MKNSSQPARGSYYEHNERVVQHPGLETHDDELDRESRLIEQLLTMGFLWEEAVQLLALRANLYENAEMLQRQAEDRRMLFARWLYEQGEITEN